VAAIRLEGFALHAGTVAAVTLAAHDGPLTFRRGDQRAALESLRVTRSDFGVRLSDERGLEVDLVEHLLAAFGGLGIRRGVVATIEGPELPILDGGARAYAEALARLNVASEAPSLAVARSGRLTFESSAFEFEPGEQVAVEVEVSFEHPSIGSQSTRWDGARDSFCSEIAPARTFGFAGQLGELVRRGRAGLAARALETRGTALEAFRAAVVVFDDGANASRDTTNEVARHKLLDLIGDFALYGGPPAGRVVATHPGHTATHHVVRRALDCGILSRR
jgi:UDP-3-O-[3-hydroxymyristoyl] N-acetylglucosamine deacetylase